MDFCGDDWWDDCEDDCGVDCGDDMAFSFGMLSGVEVVSVLTKYSMLKGVR